MPEKIPPEERSRIVRGLFVTAGMVSLALGIIGIAVPLLPTTPFLLLAAACFARGSRRFHTWLIQNRVLGAYIENYRTGRGISMRAKLATLAVLWAGCSLSAVFLATGVWTRLILLAVAAAVSAHILTVRTFRP